MGKRQNTRKHHKQESQQVSPFPAGDHTAARNSGAFRLRTSVYLLRTLIPTFAHDIAYHLRTLFTPY